MVKPIPRFGPNSECLGPQSLYIRIHFSMAHRIVDSRHLHNLQAATPAATRQRIVRQYCAFPKVNQIFIFVHRNILFRSDKTFWIHIFIRFWEFRWLNFSSYSVMCFRSRFFSLSSSSSSFVPLHAFCLSLCVCSFCYLLCAIATTLCHFQNWNSYYLLSFFSSSSSHSHSALSAAVAAAVFVWCVCSWVELHG